MRENVASVQFLRFIAAALVVLHHSTEGINQYFSGSISNLTMGVTDFGAVGVDIFFVISGFIMVYTSFRTKDETFSSSKFIAKRIIRIYPIYIIYSLFYLCFYHFFLGGKNISLEQFFGSILLLPGYSSDIIGPGWTLSFEIYFYACFSIAMALGLVRGISALTFFFLAAIMLRFASDTSQPAIHVITSTLLIEFLLGAWIGYAVVSFVRIDNKLANVLLTFALAGFVAGIYFGFYTRLSSVVTRGIPSALLVAGLVFKEKNGRLPLLMNKYSFLGDSSYSLYLLHVVLIDAVIVLALYVGDSIRTHMLQIGTFEMMIVCFGITAYCIVVAFISYELIERRLVGRLQDLYRRKTAPVPAAPA